jgi:hypothetical protein
VCLAVFNKTKLPGTLVTRSIHIPLKKKLRSEQAVPFSLYHDVKPLQQIAQMIRRWCDDNRERVQELLIARIERERAADGAAGALFNRLADKWRPLFAIAEAIDLLPVVEHVAAELIKLDARRSEEESDMGVPLLGDCKQIFDELKRDIRYDQLPMALNQMHDRPWGTMRLGGVDQFWVAKQLRVFDIRPERRRDADGRHYWYTRKMFEDAWARNLSSPT